MSGAKFFGVWKDDDDSIKVGDPRASREAAVSVVAKAAGDRVIEVVEAASKADARQIVMDGGVAVFAEPTAEDIAAVVAGNENRRYWVGGMLATGDNAVDETSYDTVEAAEQAAKDGGQFVPDTAVVLVAESQSDALRTLSELGGVHPDRPVESTKVKRARKADEPKPEPLTDEEITAALATLPEGHTAFPISSTGRVYSTTRTPRGGIHDFVFAESPNLMDLWETPWETIKPEVVGAIRATKVSWLHGASCNETDAAANALQPETADATASA